MAKYTLLELTQKILSSMDGDEVTSISDTAESLQVSKIIESAYFDIINRSNLPELSSLIQLNDSGDNTLPVVMFIPPTAEEVLWIKYDVHTLGDPLEMRDVKYLELKDFLDKMYLLDTTDSTTGTISLNSNSEALTIPYKNNKAPQWYTSTDDYTLIFDSYDVAVDTRLMGSKSLAAIKNVIPFTQSDSFTPDLDDPQFQLLLNEAKSLAWSEMRQSPHTKAEQLAKRGWTSLQRSKYKSETISDFDKLPNFGRK